MEVLQGQDGKECSKKSSPAQKDKINQNRAHPLYPERHLAYGGHDDGFPDGNQPHLAGTLVLGTQQYRLDVPTVCPEGRDADMGEHPGKGKAETPCQRGPQHPLCQPPETNLDGHQVGHAGSNQE